MSFSPLTAHGQGNAELRSVGCKLCSLCVMLRSVVFSSAQLHASYVMLRAVALK